jgi:hypothetical protein
MNKTLKPEPHWDGRKNREELHTDECHREYKKFVDQRDTLRKVQSNCPKCVKRNAVRPAK